MSRPPALTRPRALFASIHPAAAMPAPASAQGRSGNIAGCASSPRCPRGSGAGRGNGGVRGRSSRTRRRQAGPATGQALEEAAERIARARSSPRCSRQDPGPGVQGPQPRQQPVPSAGSGGCRRCGAPGRGSVPAGGPRTRTGAGRTSFRSRMLPVAERRAAGHGGEGEGAQGCSHPHLWCHVLGHAEPECAGRGYPARRDGSPGLADAFTGVRRGRRAPSGKMGPMAAMKDRLRT